MLYIAIRGGCDGADMGFSLTSSAGASSGPQKLAFGFGAKTKPPKLAAFAQDSDDDEEPAKRRRRDTAGRPCALQRCVMHARRPAHSCAPERLSSWRDQTPALRGRRGSLKCARLQTNLRSTSQLMGGRSR